MFGLLLFTSLSAAAENPDALRSYTDNRLVVTGTLNGYEVWTGNYESVSTKDFARRVDPVVYARYRGISGLVRTSSLLLWVGGSVVGYSACLSTLVVAPNSPTTALVTGSYCGLGLTMVVGGFGLYHGALRSLENYPSWWDEPSARALAEEYNGSLQDQLGLDDQDLQALEPEAGIQWTFGPNRLAVLW